MFGIPRRKSGGPNIVMAAFMSGNTPAEPPANHPRHHLRRGAADHKAVLAAALAKGPTHNNRAPAMPRGRAAGTAPVVPPVADPRPAQGGS